MPPTTSVGISGLIVDDQGVPIPGASVTAVAGSLAGGTAPASTSSAGTFQIELTTSTAAVLRVEKAGFMPMVRVASDAGNNATFAARIELQPVAASVSFDAAQAAVLRVPGSVARVTLAANTLVRVDGNAISGAANVALTPIDPSSNIAMMPGLMVDAGNGAPIESLGALAINFADATGAPLNLARGQTATLRIPATPARGATLPDTFPLYYLNETTGRWVQEGSATLQTDAATGAKYYEGQVSHFSFWNVDQQTTLSFYDLQNADTGACAYSSGSVVVQKGVSFNGSNNARPEDGRLPVRAASLSDVSLLKDGVIVDTQRLTTPAVGTTAKLPRCFAEIAKVTVSGRVNVTSGTLAGYSVQLSGANLLPTTVALGSGGNYSTQVYGNRGPISARLVGNTGRRDTPDTAVTAVVSGVNVSLPDLTVADTQVELTGCVQGWASYRQDRAQLTAFKGSLALAPPLVVTANNNTFRFTAPINSTVSLVLTPPDAGLNERRTSVDVGSTPVTLSTCLALPQAPSLRVAITGNGLARQLDARASTPGDAAITSFAWDFGDGSRSAGALVNHTFGAAGSYVVSLVATDAQGQTTNFRSTLPVTPAATFSVLTPATQMGTGFGYACAIALGSPWCWGSNERQNLGRAFSREFFDDGTSVLTGLVASAQPLQVDSSITTATAVSAGIEQACVLLADGSVKCWGLGTFGQLGNGTNTSSPTPESVLGINTAKALATGNSHVCALLTNGTVACWGRGENGELGNGDFANANVPVPVSGISNAVALTAGPSHTCALLADSTLRCWGAGRDGKLGNGLQTNSSLPVTPVGVTGVFSVSAGSDRTCAVLSSGQIKCWGTRGFVGFGVNQGLLGDGRGGGPPALIPVTVSVLTNAVSVSVGRSHTCAILADASVWCWGFASAGEMGGSLGSLNQFVPVKVNGIGPAAALSAGDGFTCAVLTSGAVQCLGSNSLGKLGNNGVVITVDARGNVRQTEGDSFTPVNVLLP
jgi:alpha-tubulin suppressor-like RCC1 family protein